jgi:phospholipase C
VGALALAALVAAAVMATGSRASNSGHGHAAVTQPTIPAGIHKIQHVVIIMQENRSFDSYFGTFPHADGIPGLGGHPGKVPCIPDPKRHKCVQPYHDRYDHNIGGPHAAKAALADINRGKMNGFIAQQETMRNWASIKPADDAVGYHNRKDLPNYWTYAHDYVLQDHMFESTYSYSLPAHLFLVSLWSARCADKGGPSTCHYSSHGPAVPPGFRPHQTNKAPNYAWTDLTYLLHKHHVSWGYYIFKGIEPDCESNLTASCAPVTQGPMSNSIWNPLRYFADVRQDGQLRNIHSLNAFFNAANQGKLPAVSWIMPNRNVSEHPSTALISPGQTYVTGLIDTIMQSPDWKSTAIFVAWDDWGGLYDNVRPPHIDVQGYGLRVPAFMISPYARQGYIDHQTLSFDAYAKFIEDDFLGGQRLNPRTDGRPDPRPDVREQVHQLGDLLNEFNFNQTPLSAVMLPVHPKTDLKR